MLASCVNVCYSLTVKSRVYNVNSKAELEEQTSNTNLLCSLQNSLSHSEAPPSLMTS